MISKERDIQTCSDAAERDAKLPLKRGGHRAPVHESLSREADGNVDHDEYCVRHSGEVANLLNRTCEKICENILRLRESLTRSTGIL